MLKKTILTIVLISVIAVLFMGAVNRTLFKMGDNLPGSGLVTGRGQGYGRGQGSAIHNPGYSLPTGDGFITFNK